MGSAEDDTGQYLDPPKSEKESLVVSLDWTASQNKFGSSAVLLTSQPAGLISKALPGV